MRPLAPFVDAETAPPVNRPSQSPQVGAPRADATVVAAVATTVSDSDSSRMRRSPTRSSAHPHSTVVATIPTIGADAKTDAAGRLIPSACSRGIRKATPLARHVVAIAANSDVARITQRRASDTVPDVDCKVYSLSSCLVRYLREPASSANLVSERCPN